MTSRSLPHPMLGLCLGGAHAWMRLMHFWTGAWMLTPRKGEADDRR